MIRLVAVGGGGIGSLREERCPVPQPGLGQALVRLRAATLNYRDLIGLRGGLPGLTREPDYVPLSCGCGEVVSVGDDVQRVRAGQRVIPMFAQGWLSGGPENMGTQHLGGQAEGVARTHALFPAESLSVIPDELGDLEAATLPCAGITAWSSLFGPRPIRPGDLVVLQGTGGVSIAALQFAKAAGAEVAITSSSEAKLSRARALGADHLVNYREHADWAAEIRGRAGRGADVVVDVVGATQLEQSAAVLGAGGVIAAVGMLDGLFSWGQTPGVAVAMVTVGNRDAVDAMLRGVAVNGIRPVVDRVFPLQRLSDALHALERGDFFGKIGIQID